MEDACSEADDVEDEDDGTEEPPEGRHEPGREGLKITYSISYFLFQGLLTFSWNAKNCLYKILILNFAPLIVCYICQKIFNRV
jgi:hypothetical protein